MQIVYKFLISFFSSEHQNDSMNAKVAKTTPSSELASSERMLAWFAHMNSFKKRVANYRSLHSRHRHEAVVLFLFGRFRRRFVCEQRWTLRIDPVSIQREKARLLETFRCSRPKKFRNNKARSSGCVVRISMSDVGRVPVHTAASVHTFLSDPKLKIFESDPTFTSWQPEATYGFELLVAHNCIKRPSVLNSFFIDKLIN